MTLIKLDSGDYLPTDNLGYIDHKAHMAYFKKPVIMVQNDMFTNSKLGLSVTEADCERIAEAMNDKHEAKLDAGEITKAVNRALMERTMSRMRGAEQA